MTNQTKWVWFILFVFNLVLGIAGLFVVAFTESVSTLSLSLVNLTVAVLCFLAAK